MEKTTSGKLNTNAAIRTHVAKISVEDFDIAVDHLEGDELVIFFANLAYEIKRGIAPVNDLV